VIWAAGAAAPRAAWAGRGGCLDSPVAPRVAAWRCAPFPSFRPDGAHGVTVFLFGAAQLPLVSSPVSGSFFPGRVVAPVIAALVRQPRGLLHL